jgi:hypothetical protein
MVCIRTISGDIKIFNDNISTLFELYTILNTYFDENQCHFSIIDINTALTDFQPIYSTFDDYNHQNINIENNELIVYIYDCYIEILDKLCYYIKMKNYPIPYDYINQLKKIIEKKYPDISDNKYIMLALCKLSPHFF